MVKWAKHFEVSTSGYYVFLSNEQERLERQATLDRQIREVFSASRGTYGVHRVCGKLRKDGIRCSYKKVKRRMDIMGLFSIHRRYQKSLTNSKKARGDGFPNLLRGAIITHPFQAICSDITYIPTDEGFDYLCQIRDVVSNVVLAQRQDATMSQELVQRTILAAKRGWNLSEGTIFHSDRGSQYTATKTMALLKRLGFRQSFSRVGKPGDNAWCESYFSILKKEAIHGFRFKTRTQARQAVFSFTFGFYNTHRIQMGLGFLSPLQWLEKWRMDHSSHAA